MRDHGTVMSYLISNNILFLYHVEDIVAQILEVILKLAMLPGYVYVATEWTLKSFQAYVYWLFWRNLASTAIKRQGRTADSVLQSQMSFLKMLHYLSGVLSVHKLSLLLCGLPAVTLEQLFDLLLMLKSTVFWFIFLFSRAWLCFGVCLSQLEECRKGEIRPLYWACHREFVLLPGIVLGAP